MTDFFDLKTVLVNRTPRPAAHGPGHADADGIPAHHALAAAWAGRARFDHPEVPS